MFDRHWCKWVFSIYDTFNQWNEFYTKAGLSQIVSEQKQPKFHILPSTQASKCYWSDSYICVQLIEMLTVRMPGLQIVWSIHSEMCKLIFEVVISLSEVFNQSNSEPLVPRVVFSQFICCEFSMNEFPLPFTDR